MAAPTGSPEVNYWMFGGGPEWRSETQIEVRPDDHLGAIQRGDIAFLRVPNADRSDELIGWGECSVEVRDGPDELIIVSARHWQVPIALADLSELWTLSYFRDPDHMIHGLSGREASILVSRSSEGELPPPPFGEGRRGTIDEVLVAAADIWTTLGPAPTEQAVGSDGDPASPSLGTAAIAEAASLLGSLDPDAYPVAAELGNRITGDGSVSGKDLEQLAASAEHMTRSLLWDPTTPSNAMPPLDSDARDVVAFADALARRLPDHPVATDAHLAVALLAAAGPVTSADDRAQADLIIPVIARDLPPDRLGDWWMAVGLPPKSSAIAAIAPDSTAGVDKLRRTDDIRSFANAIASRSMQPPLSIGVFGEWGAGKTFFMRKLRDEIDRINANVKKMPVNEPIGYCERIAQVEFNAWHYAETKLWSSLIHHMLANLAVGQGDEKDVLTERLLDQLTEASEDVEAKKRAVAEAEADVRQAEWKACVTKKRLEVAQRKAGEVTSKDVWEEVSDDPEIRAKVGALGERLGQAPIGKGTIALYKSVGDTIELVSGGLNVLRLKDRDAPVPAHWWRTVAAMIAIVVIAGVGAVFLDRVADLPVVAGAVVALGPLGSLMAGVANWLDVQNRRGQEVVNDLTAARDRLQGRHDEKVKEQQAAALAARQHVEALVARREDANADLAAAEATRDAAEKALKTVTPQERLAEFVRSRTDEYRSHLGLVTAVRQDFEKLHRLLSDIRAAADERRRPRHDDEPAPAARDKSANGGLEIDRIVVYIDDLDRCKPETVVKVLEAVHLLLAFEFIVVVVGVDARWVGRSLLKTYPNMLGAATSPLDLNADADADPDNDPDANPAPEPDNGATRRQPRELLQRPASEHDYIEKIFQVPYWLEPLNAKTVGDLVSSVVGPTTVFGADDVTVADVVATGRTGNQVAQPFEVSDTGKEAISQLHTRLDESIGFNPNPERLTISDRELLFMDVVYPLVSRSPRSAKRFVNVYRVIKAGLGEDDIATWVSGEQTPTPCHAVILLLAIVCGTPQSSTVALGELADLDDTDGWVEVKEAIGRAMTPLRADERRRWLETQQRYEKSTWIRLTAGDVKPWLGRVARYSFRSGHLDLVRPLAMAPLRRGSP